MNGAEVTVAITGAILRNFRVWSGASTSHPSNPVNLSNGLRTDTLRSRTLLKF